MCNYTADATSVQPKIPLTTFLAAFYPDEREKICLRAIKPKDAPDSLDNRTEKLCITRVQLGDNQLRQRLKVLNTTRGLYFVVNAGGDKDDSITRFNACFVERDDIPIAEQRQALDRAPLSPSILIETRKSVHAYWLIAGDCNASTWYEIQRRLIAFFHGDKANKNLSRVMRLPYFDHLFYEKETGSTERRSVELVSFNASCRYSVNDLLAAFPSTVLPQIPKGKETRDDVRRIREGERNTALTSIAGKLRRAGLSEESIYAALIIENQQDCEPPLEADEVRSIARSISRYEPGDAPLVFVNGQPAPTEPSPKSDEGLLKVVSMADVEPETVTWLWYPYIARGKFTIIEGDPGLGKSWLMCALACAVSRGQGFPGVAEPSEPRNVLMLSAEDGLGDTIRPRLNAVGADVRHVYALNEPLTFNDSGLLRLEAAIIEYTPLLVIIDPLFAFTGGKVDINRANECRAISAPLAAIAERNVCSLVAVRHLGKARGGGHALNAGIGSIDFTAAARSVLLVGRDPDDNTKRAIVQTKNNLAPEGKAVGFKVEGAKFYWTGASDLTAARMLAVGSKVEACSALDEAVIFFRDTLGEGEREIDEVKAEARRLSISDATLRRARERLNIRARRQGLPGSLQRFTWSLPDNVQNPSDDA
jgi:hypothetical protein